LSATKSLRISSNRYSVSRLLLLLLPLFPVTAITSQGLDQFLNNRGDYQPDDLVQAASDGLPYFPLYLALVFAQNAHRSPPPSAASTAPVLFLNPVERAIDVGIPAVALQAQLGRSPCQLPM